MKVRFLATGLFDVEPRESHDGARGEDEGEQPFPSAAVRLLEVHEQRGREAEGNGIDQ